MKIKQFFLLPVALLAIFFAYCTKEQQPNLTPKEVNTGTVDSRVAKCLVTVTVNSGSVAVCGTNNMLTACGNVGATILRGNENINAPLARVYGVLVPTGGFGFIQLTPIAGPAPVSVTVSTATNAVTYTVFPAAGPLTVSIDEMCTVL